jgi:chemotaxis protein histidine kinase CheA
VVSERLTSTTPIDPQAITAALDRILDQPPTLKELAAAIPLLHDLKTSPQGRRSQALRMLAHAGERLLSETLASNNLPNGSELNLLRQLRGQVRTLLAGDPGAPGSSTDDPYQLVRSLTMATTSRTPPKAQSTASALTRRLRRRGDHPREQARFVDQVLDLMLVAETTINARPDAQAVNEVARCLDTVEALAAFLGLDPIVAHIRAIEQRLMPIASGRTGLSPADLSWLRGVLDHLRLLAVDPHHGSAQGKALTAEVPQEQLARLVELGINLRNRLGDHPDPQVMEHVQELLQLSRGLLLTPLAPILSRLDQVAQESADRLGRKVAVVTSGEHFSIPRPLSGLLEECLIHLIRNAVDHGIETPSDRRRAGKDERGRLQLAAMVTDRSLIVRVTDDGAGMDPQEIIRIAVAKRLIPPDSQLEQRDILRLVLIAGFTSATGEGRGIGLDAVLDALERSGGTLEIESSPGTGSSFILRLPLPKIAGG